MELKVVVNMTKNDFLALSRSSEVNSSGSQTEKRQEKERERKFVLCVFFFVRKIGPELTSVANLPLFA